MILVQGLGERVVRFAVVGLVGKTPLWRLLSFFLSFRHARFRIGVFVAIFNEQGKILLVKHSYGKRKWSLPGGGLEENETNEEGCVREIREETGLSILVRRVIGIYEQHQTQRPKKKLIKIVLYEGEPTGGLLQRRTLETDDCGFFGKTSLPDLYPGQRRLVADAFLGSTETCWGPLVRDS